MPSDNLGRAVKWQGVDGGWRTGRIVLMPSGNELICQFDFDPRSLVKESCDGRLTWAIRHKLQDWQPRSEWEEAAEANDEEFAKLQANAALRQGQLAADARQRIMQPLQDAVAPHVDTTV